MKKFMGEFKTFISRGNVLDMSVGVIVGGAFTAIVNGMSNFILNPIINWVLLMVIGENSMSETYTFLSKKMMLDESGNEVLDLANSIYIDWGSFINAIINFILIALVLFIIVRWLNRVKSHREKIRKARISREDRRAMRAQGIKLCDKAAVQAYFEAKAQAEAEEKARAEAEAAQAARLEREANPTTEDLLKRIIVLMESK